MRCGVFTVSRESQKIAAECFAAEASEDVDDLPANFLDDLNIDEVTKIRMRLSNPDVQPAKMADLRMKNLKLLTKKSQRYLLYGQQLTHQQQQL